MPEKADLSDSRHGMKLNVPWIETPGVQSAGRRLPDQPSMEP